MKRRTTALFWFVDISGSPFTTYIHLLWCRAARLDHDRVPIDSFSSSDMTPAPFINCPTPVLVLPFSLRDGSPTVHGEPGMSLGIQPSSRRVPSCGMGQSGVPCRRGAMTGRNEPEREQDAQQALGALLRQYRQRGGLTQEELAERAGSGLSVYTISNAERGRTRPSRHTLHDVLAALELNDVER